MASPSPSLLSILCLLSYFSLPFIFASPLNRSTASTIIPLSHFSPNQSSSSSSSSSSFLSWQMLNRLAAASLKRARRLKNPVPAASTTSTPLFTHSYGGYSISLSFGTPPQTIPFIMDTGSELVWFPCTSNYICSNCSFSSSKPPPIPSFRPKLSSSSKILGCLNPKCGWIHNPDAHLRCRDCDPKSRSNCTQICPPYIILYGSGTTGGIMLSETLDLAEKRVPDFAVGCSLFSSQQPAGIAGFGRGRASMPSQLGLKKFSYCLLSHRFDDTGESSSLVLDSGTDSGKKTAGVSYTPFLKNPIATGFRTFSAFYYVGLRKIAIGGKRVKIPSKYFAPGPTGNGGTIVDSGTTFTFMAPEVFRLVAGEFMKRVRYYRRARETEALTGLRPCFNVSGVETVSFPELSFHFKGGAHMRLPPANYYSLVGNSAACLTIVTDGDGGPEISGGPSIILGNFQMQNFYVEYDLRNERLGFRRQQCL
ncbi:probable aspartyl protease At4g16563 [Malania oleifera]|uniref:probable aspartyl protease At4g16563 n=1 Tax=Malania oleifera TaxID=397392 RepID=UPI0025ADD564|nr:probable aspartyl protease At4g16563 [Malania oleifera]